jgi:hypothetical protein
MTKGDSFTCRVCGLVVLVDEVYDCLGVFDIICLGKLTKERLKSR